MSDTTTAGHLTVPDLDDAADGPFGFMQLAQQLEDKGVLHSMGVPRRVWWTVYGGQNTDASGFVTYAHTAGFTPRGALLVQLSPATRYPVVWGVDSFTATTFRARFEMAAGTTVPNAVDAGPQFAILFE